MVCYSMETRKVANWSKARNPLAALAVAAFVMIGAQPAAIAGSAQIVTFRAVEIAGSQTLRLRSGPDAQAPIVIDVPFDTRGLKPTGVHERGWQQLTFVTEHREEFTGWARTSEVMPDDVYAPTVFRIVDAGGAGVPALAEPGWGRSVGVVPAGARGVLALGNCESGFCPVRYVGKKRRVEGWVSAGNLAVAGPRSADHAKSAGDDPNAADLQHY